jgi:hypothetical protein
MLPRKICESVAKPSLYNKKSPAAFTAGLSSKRSIVYYLTISLVTLIPLAVCTFTV